MSTLWDIQDRAPVLTVAEIEAGATHSGARWSAVQMARAERAWQTAEAIATIRALGRANRGGS